MHALHKIFEGSSIRATLILDILKEKGIEPIVKDRSESARLAGFASEIPMQVEIFVFENQADEALQALQNIPLDES
ncbi:MAG: DUF2007 domain-containing protein [Capnocytophaga sp.]|nr:DUF2007 domain-containing protein [Capnocytophaga sp.]